MKAVIDTNVLVAGLLNPSGNPARVLDMVALGELVPVFDDRILSEYRAVLARPRFEFDAEEIEAVLKMMEETGRHITAPPLGLKLPDVDDACFIEVAVEARCDFLITGNRKHYPVRVIKKLDEQILVLSSGEFIAKSIEIYTPGRRAEFLLSNTMDEEDYIRAREDVSRMGLDPDKIPHRKPGNK